MGVVFYGARVPTGIYGPPNMGMGMKTPVLLVEHQTVLKTELSSPPRLRLTNILKQRACWKMSKCIVFPVSTH